MSKDKFTRTLTNYKTERITMSRMAAETELDVDVRSVQGSPRLYLRLNWGFWSEHNLVHQ